MIIWIVIVVYINIDSAPAESIMINYIFYEPDADMINVLL